MALTIVDYKAGNLRSVVRACRAVGIEPVLCHDPDELRKADRVVFPGVGHAQTAMEHLNSTGLGEALHEVWAKGNPLLGICVGAQLILGKSEESCVPCLNLLPGEAKRFQTNDPSLKIPHMGWNDVTVVQSHPLLEGLKPGDELYFVHSYYPCPERDSDRYAVSEHGGEFCCAIGHENLFATQFHPEKSAKIGLDILRRFASWR